MKSRINNLLEAYKNLLKVKGDCSCEISRQCAPQGLTIKQVEYLKIIDNHREITFSMLADLTRNSKPTITEMINKFISFKCVYKEPCRADRRVSYIQLTEQGRKIARREEAIIERLVQRINNSLDDEEIDMLINLLRKIR